jgi:hypothetical protein
MGRPALIVTPALARAIRSESASAIAYWFGVTPAAVSRYRKLLGVTQRLSGKIVLPGFSDLFIIVPPRCN